MNFNISEENIKASFGDIVYNRGRDMYLRNKIRKVDVIENSKSVFSIASTVESADDLKDYKVKIIVNGNNGATYYSCTCHAFSDFKKCKHISALFIKLSREGINGVGGNKSILNYGDQLLDYYKNAVMQNYSPNHIVNMSTTLEFAKSYHRGYPLELKVGLDRLYVVKNIREFIESIFINKKNIQFGKGFTFEPEAHYFSKEDYEILNFIKEIYDINEEINNNIYVDRSILISGKRVYLTNTQLVKFLNLRNKKYISAKIHNEDYNAVEVSIEDMPLNFNISLQKEKIRLTLEEEVPKAIDNSNRVYLYENKIYVPSEKQVNALLPMLRFLTKKSNNSVDFSKEQIQEVATYVLPNLKAISKNLNQDKSISSLVKEEPLKIKYYLDKETHGVSCDVVFNYGEVDFNLEHSKGSKEDVVIIRNLEEEKISLRALEDFGFHQEKGKFQLKDEEGVMEFITEGLENLNKLGEVYYSDSFKGIKVIHSKSFKSSISLNDSNLLEFEFNIEGVDKEELKGLFISLKQKKKYHKLKNGSIVPLQSEEVESFQSLIESLDIDAAKFSKGNITLPKYASLYINDKIKNNNLEFIGRNKAFRELINTIKDVKDADYELPEHITGTLRDYQKIGFRWFKTLAFCDFGGILGDEMGLGKTFQAITYIVSEKEEGKLKNPALIVCPTSLVYNWLSEFEKFAPNMKVLVISGSKSERDLQREELLNHDVVITSYPLIRRDIDDYKDIKFSMTILDEAQHIKNPASLNAQSVKEIKSAKRFALTGTPMENSLTELWSIFDFIMPGYLKTHGRFIKTFETPIVKDKNEKSLQELLKLIRPFILRRFKRDVALELPPKIEHKVVVEMTEEQKKLYASYVTSFKEEVKEEIKEKGFNRSKLKILSLLTRLRQICCDPSSFLDNYKGDSGKYTALDDILEESIANNHRILLFSQFTSILNNIKARISKTGIKSMYLDGSTPSKDRMAMVKEFNEGNADVFLISLKAGGTGLNLTGADLVIHFDPWWNPAVEDQAVDRAHRIGQTKTVEVIKLITKGTIEEKIYALQEKKKEIIESVLDGENHNDVVLSAMTEEEVEDLFKI
ncbi:DEAD/DEAH box helicase [Clostridium sp.]|uniref:DEAD/DEAH box helicase n=1 Tax=Clostridium sp. TaxID=1506 RepID=UPI002FC5D891